MEHVRWFPPIPKMDLGPFDAAWPTRLEALAEMLKLSAHNLVMLAGQITRLQLLKGKPPMETVPDEARSAFLSSLVNLRPSMVAAGFSYSVAAIDEAIRYLEGRLAPPQYGRLAQHGIALESHVYHELAATYAFVIEGRRRELFEGNHLFGEAVGDAYPSASMDIAEAGKCLALDRYPACIFHLMRVAERALRIIAGELGVPLASSKKGRSWGGVIVDINRALADMDDNAPKKVRLREPMYFVSEVKDLWRDKGIHPGDDFSPERTERVYNAIRSFMATCAEKGIVETDEEGLPLS